jgi:hypothetical protein
MVYSRLMPSSTGHRLGACLGRLTGPCQPCGTGSRLHELPSEPPTHGGWSPDLNARRLGPYAASWGIPLRGSRSPRLSHRSGLAEDGKGRLAHGKAALVLHNN